MEEAVFAMGCFWHPQKLFDELEGVLETEVGYTGGDVDNPTYREVCTGDTGHAEAVKIVFDEDEITYEELLDVFWKNHDYCQLNRQGPDVGTQYRSAIFWADEEQKRLAEKTKPDDAVTEITEFTEWWPAEEYHQHYENKRKSIF